MGSTSTECSPRFISEIAASPNRRAFIPALRSVVTTLRPGGGSPAVDDDLKADHDPPLFVPPDIVLIQAATKAPGL